MKKTLLLLTVFFTINASVLADGLTATLQQGDQMKAFYGVDAFKQAYEAANDGAVITLSSGEHNDVSTIEKSVTIIGAYAFDVKSPETTILASTTINANNVKIEGIYFSGTVTLGAVSDCQIKRCWVEAELTSMANHTNTLVDQCVIKKDKAIAKGHNYCIKNSTIYWFTGMNSSSNMAYITNCVVWNWVTNDAASDQQPCGIYKNNILGIFIYSGNFYTPTNPSEFYYNVFLQIANSSSSKGVNENSECLKEGNYTNWLFEKYYSGGIYDYPAQDMKDGLIPLGQDGTPVGIMGGTGFSAYPSIPRIISREIDSNTDDTGKLNVKITVQAQQ